MFFGFQFEFLFFGGVASFVRFWGSFLRLEWPCRGALGVKNVQKSMYFSMFFANAGCFFFEACDGSFGLILALLGCSDPKMDPKMGSKMFQNGFQNCLKIV